MFASGKPFQPSLMFLNKVRAQPYSRKETLNKARAQPYSRKETWPYFQTLL